MLRAKGCLDSRIFCRSKSSVSYMGCPLHKSVLTDRCQPAAPHRANERVHRIKRNSRVYFLVSNPLHILEQNLLTATVIKFCCPAVGMTGNPLGHLQLSSILQEIRDSGSPKRMGRKCIRQSGVFEPAFEHSGCIDSGRRPLPELSRLAQGNWKKGCGWPICKTRYLQILVQKLLQFVMHRDLRLLAAFLPEPDH